MNLLAMQQIHINEITLIAIKSLQKQIERVDGLSEDIIEKQFEMEQKSGIDFKL